jgi:hypothetical protein
MEIYDKSQKRYLILTIVYGPAQDDKKEHLNCLTCVQILRFLP